MRASARTLMLAAWFGWIVAAGAAQAAHPHKQDGKHADKRSAKREPPPKPVEATPSTVDPDGEGFLKLYADLCVKRIDNLGAFRRKLLRTKVPKLQPERAALYLSGVDGDAWPVSYKGKTGNFVLVLSEDNDQCMLYARRTDRVAVEQGFADLLADIHPNARANAARRGDTRTLAATVRPRGEQAARFALTTQAAPDVKWRALGSVERNPRAEPAPAPKKASKKAPKKALKKARQLTKRANGSPAPARPPHAQP